MMMLLSILIPSIPNRLDRLASLFERIGDQIGRGGHDNIEVLSFLDNKKRSIGLKRDALVQTAQGEYLAFVDDDDLVYDNYVDELVGAVAPRDVDVIVFKEHAQVNGGNVFTVTFGLEYENQEAQIVGGRWVDITRKPWHPCAWRSSIAKSEHFPDASYGEDWHWCKRLVAKAKSQRRINAVLSMYVFDDRVTEAEHVFPKD